MALKVSLYLFMYMYDFFPEIENISQNSSHTIEKLAYSLKLHKKDFAAKNPELWTVNPLYNNITYNSKILFKVNLTCTKPVDHGSFLVIFLCYSLGKHMLWILVRIALLR